MLARRATRRSGGAAGVSNRGMEMTEDQSKDKDERNEDGIKPDIARQLIAERLKALLVHRWVTLDPTNDARQIERIEAQIKALS